MCKFVILLSLCISTAGYAAPKQMYTAEFAVVENGKTLESQGLTVQEGTKGGAQQETEKKQELSLFDVVVVPGKGDALTVDYHCKVVKGAKKFEFSRTASAMTLEKPEVITLKDSAGNAVQYTVTIKKIAK